MSYTAWVVPLIGASSMLTVVGLRPVPSLFVCLNVPILPTIVIIYWYWYVWNVAVCGLYFCDSVGSFFGLAHLSISGVND
jgi:hypothetical protein